MNNVYSELSEVDNGLALLAQGRAMHDFATAERIPVVMAAQVYERYIACGLPSHRQLTRENAHMALDARDFAAGVPWGEWLATWSSEASFAKLASPNATREMVAGALLLAHNGYFVDGEVLASARPMTVRRFCPKPELRHGWAARRVISYEGRAALCDADAALASGLSLDRLRLLAGEVCPRGVIQLGKSESARLARQYPHLMEYDARAQTIMLYEEIAIISAVNEFDDADASAVINRVKRIFAQAQFWADVRPA